jgi:hypothetical protein
MRRVSMPGWLNSASIISESRVDSTKRNLYLDISAFTVLAVLSSGFQLWLVTSHQNTVSSKLELLILAIIAAYIWPLVRGISRKYWGNAFLAACAILVFSSQFAAVNAVRTPSARIAFYFSIPLICLSFSYLRLPVYVVGSGFVICVLVLYLRSSEPGSETTFNTVRIALFLASAPMLVWYLLNRSRFWKR